MKKALVIIGLSFLSAAGSAAEVFVSTAPTLAGVMAAAREKNPEILAARQAWRVVRAQIEPARTWASPTFTYVDEKFPSGSDGAPAEEIHHYRVEQMVPFPGKLTSDARMRYHEALIAEAAFEAKQLEMVGAARTAYGELYRADQNIALAEQNAQALRSVLKTAQARLASGQSTASDVFLAEVELRKTENRLFEQRQARSLAEAELNALLDQPTTTRWGPAQPPALADLPLSLEDFLELARRNAPQYRSAMHETNHAKQMLIRNRLELAPDFELMYEREVSHEGDAGRQIGIGLELPLWLPRPIGLYQASREHLLETEAMSHEAQNMVEKMVHMEFTETTTHLALSRSYETDILPAARSNLNVAREQYASGRGDFLRVLEALRTWLETNNEYQEQLYHYNEHWGILERWLGVDLARARDILTEQRSMNKEMSHEN